MARIRTIKPDFWTSEQIVECSRDARLLFIGLWNFADDYGVIPARVRSIKMKVLPGEDDLTIDTVQKMLDELLGNGLLHRFTADDGRDYLHVTGWADHQRIDRPRHKYPQPPDEPQEAHGSGEQSAALPKSSASDRSVGSDDSPADRGVFDDNSTNDRRTLDDSSTLDQGRDTEPSAKERCQSDEPSTTAARNVADLSRRKPRRGGEPSAKSRRSRKDASTPVPGAFDDNSTNDRRTLDEDFATARQPLENGSNAENPDGGATVAQRHRDGSSAPPQNGSKNASTERTNNDLGGDQGKIRRTFDEALTSARPRKGREGNGKGSTSLGNSNTTGQVHTAFPETPDQSAAAAVGNKPIITRRKRKLTGERKRWFLDFWQAFDLKRDRASAADAWLDIPGLDAELAQQITAAAQAEAAARPAQARAGKKPKWAQGWLNGRRWEDEHGGKPIDGANDENRIPNCTRSRASQSTQRLMRIAQGED